MPNFEMNGTVIKRGRTDANETSIVLPTEATKVGKCAFRKNKTLTFVNMNVLVTEIGDQAFENCENLCGVRIPSPAPGLTGLLRIGHQAFSGCAKLEACCLPDGLQELGRWAFSHCPSLADISLPDSISVMYDHAFCGCSALRQIRFPANMTNIPAGTFAYCESLEAVTIPEGVTEIHAEAFMNCVSLHEITLPKSLTLLSRDVFQGSGLRSIRIPASVTVLANAFRDCAELTEIVFEAFPEKDTKLRKNIEDMLWESPELADKILRANAVPQDFRDYAEWMRREKNAPAEALPQDGRPWYEAIIEMLPQDDYILLMDTHSQVSMELYHVIGDEYTRNSSELFGARFGKTPPYERWKEHFRQMMDSDQALRAYRYEKGALTEVRELSRQVYDPWVYDGCVNAVILRREFGLEPKHPDLKAQFAENLAKAEKFMQTLVYACYVDDRPAILERAAKASKTALNEKFEYFGTPLTFCAKHDFLEGFRAITERGGDLTKQIVAGTVCPIREAMLHSPAITLYIAQEHPEAFDRHYQNWAYDLLLCEDLRVWEILYRRWGSQGMEKLIFSLLRREENVSTELIRWMVGHGADVQQYTDPDCGCNAQEFAKQMFEKYGDDAHRQAWEILKRE